MIFVIAPLVKGHVTSRYYIRLLAYSATLVAAATAAFGAYGVIGRYVGLGGLRLPWIGLGLACFIYAAREVGMLRLPVPSSNFVLPREWMRLPDGVSSVIYGSLMGLGFVTRAPYAAYHAVVAETIVVGAVGAALGVGLAFGVGRLVIPLAAVIAIGKGLAHPVRLNDWTKSQTPIARLISGASLAMLAGAVAATMVWR